MAYYQTYTISERLSYVRRGDLLSDLSAWERGPVAGVSFTIRSGVDTVPLISVALSDAELDALVLARDRFRDSKEIRKAAGASAPK